MFKANTKETLAGSESLARELLLIVRYPTATGFLSLLVSRTFQLVSTLRITAVRSFSFVFNKRFDQGPDQSLGAEDQPIPFKNGSQYAALMYTADGEIADEWSILRDAADSSAVSVDFFCGPAASLVLLRTGAEERPIPYVTDRVAILSAESVEALERFAASGLERALGGARDFWVGRMERSI